MYFAPSKPQADQALKLDPADLAEYHRLKGEVGAKTAKIAQERDVLGQQQAADEGALAHLRGDEQQVAVRVESIQQQVRRRCARGAVSSRLFLP